MRNVGLIAFGVTTALLVPAAVSRLVAGREQVAKLFAPGEDTLHLDDGGEVAVSLDRAIADPGETIHVQLAASQAKGKHVTLGVVVLGSSGSEGDRVPSPPVGVVHERVTLDVDATGHATRDVAIKLRGAQAGYEPFANYQILVMPPKAADRLERLRSRAGLIVEPGGGIPSYNTSGEKFFRAYWAIQGGEAPEDDAELFAPGKIARLDAHTRPLSKTIAIATPNTAPRGEPFTVMVSVTNPGKHAVEGVAVSLDSVDGLLDGRRKDRYAGLGTGAVTIEGGADKIDLAPHETRRVEFKVAAEALGTVGLYARATCDCDLPPSTFTGAVDATDIVEAPTVVGAR